MVVKYDVILWGQKASIGLETETERKPQLSCLQPRSLFVDLAAIHIKNDNLLLSKLIAEIWLLLQMQIKQHHKQSDAHTGSEPIQENTNAKLG